MAGKKVPDNIIVLFDVGCNTTEYDKSKSQTFYEQAKNCLESILMRKIFTRPTDEFALFLIGSETTSNSLNTENPGEYSHICQALEMKPMNWDMLKYVQTEMDQPNETTTGDWLDAIIVAMDYFKDLAIDKCTKKILLFTTFSNKVNGSSLHAVITGLKQLEIELIVVTKNVIDQPDKSNQVEVVTFSQSVEKDVVREKNEAIIMNIVKQSNGLLCSLDEAAAKLMYVDQKQRRSMPWNCDLEIGSHVTVKIATYIYIEDKSELSTWKARTATGELCKSRIEHYHNDTLIDPETVETETVKGYMYGGTPVPFVDVSFNNGGKGLRCIAFTKVSNIRKEYLEGSSTRMVIPQKGAEASAKKFSALLSAMRNLNLAILARYTYNNTSAPKVVALFAHDDKSMLMHELFFKDNLIMMSFPSLETRKFKPTVEQDAFMDKLMDSMDLAGATQYDHLMDPGQQHLYRVLAHRAINRNDPIPAVGNDLLALISAPKPNGIDIDEMKRLFPLEPIKLTNNEKLLKNIKSAQNEMVDEYELAANLNANHSIDITKIGTIRPAEDFLFLFNGGEPLDKLALQIQDVIVQLATKSLVSMDDKIHQALDSYREVAKQKAPFKYNEWIEKFKDLLKEREMVKLWELIVNERLGLITAQESELSTVTDANAAAFYKADEFYTQMHQSTDIHMDDDDDLLNEL